MDTVVERMRGFNRFYTRLIGVLEDGYLGSGLTLAEARVLYEIAEREAPSASDIGTVLMLDAGYLSRILKRLDAKGLVRRVRAEQDRRQSRLTLTDAGRAAVAALNAGARRDMAGVLDRLDPERQQRLAGAMSEIQALLANPPLDAPVTLRSPRPGDLGWVVERHGLLYFNEQGWGERFEAHVAELVARLRLDPDPARERCWIAERSGRRLGCVFLVKEDEATARIRLLLLEPEARGLGLGRRLVGETLSFARQAGYAEVVLWTHAQLIVARRIYADFGFEKIAEEAHDEFGPMVVSETWRLRL